jgi:hypothetical protein
MELNTKYWLKLSIVNLFIVGFLGVLMRYKIGFIFPYFDQKHIQHAHSHFAFFGWITQTLYVLILNFIQTKASLGYYKQYKFLLIANLVCAYGMLISFAIQGYGFISISFSIITILIACVFTSYFFKDFKQMTLTNTSVLWFKSALWFNIISSIGTFYLAYMMASKNFDEKWYLASVYFFLHFQYNGFFIFTCLGLVQDKIQNVLPSFKNNNSIFKLFFISFIPSYFLSTLWANLPIWLYLIVVLSALVQIVAWVKLVINIIASLPSNIYLTKLMLNLFFVVGVAFSIKLLLQLGSTIPAVSDLAFGFRPIVIAYLHLVLLAVISVFLLAYMYSFNLISKNKLSVFSLITFVTGVFINEIVLCIQGIASFSYFSIPRVNEILFGVSVLLLFSLIFLVIAQFKSSANE